MKIEDFIAKSKRREFREKLQVRADRKKARQEEREKQEHSSGAAEQRSRGVESGDSGTAVGSALGR